MILDVGSDVLRLLWCSSNGINFFMREKLTPQDFKEAIEDCRSLPLISSLTTPLPPEVVEPRPDWRIKSQVNHEGYGTITVYEVDNWRLSSTDRPISVIVKMFEPKEDVGSSILKNLQFATYGLR
jgi:hypothetical protein